MNRKRLVIIIVIIIVVIGGIVAIATFSSVNNKGSTIVDRNTGESYDPTKPATNTGGSDPTYGTTVLFGITGLTKKALNDKNPVGYVNSVKQALWKYGDNRLDKKFITLTLIPDSIKFEDKLVTGEVRLGQTDEVVPIKITINKSGDSAYVEINKGGTSHDGTFVYIGNMNNPDNYLFTITQKDDKSSDLIIETYTGYREAALTYIESLGYNVPDFSITFTNYKSVFE